MINLFVVKFLIYSLILLSVKINFCFGQKIENPFELIKGKRQIIFGLDNRRTHINNDRTVIYGVYSGVGFSDKKLRLKIGLNATPFEVGSLQNNDGLIQTNRFIFFSLGEEIDFFRLNKFVTSTYFQCGFGFNYFDQINSQNGELVSTGRNPIIPVELGLHFGYDILNWLAIKSGGGWRFVFPALSSDLGGYYFKIGLQFNPKEFLISYNRFRFRNVVFR